MKFPFKTLGLLLASLALASCGGGGGDGGSATPTNGTISLIASKVNLPRNPNGVLPFPGSPYTAELSFVFRNNAGQITALTSDATFTVNQPSIVSISPPDDPSTEDINELAQRFVSFFDTTNNGTYTLFVTSYDVAGTATVTAGATDPVTGQTVTASITFTVEGAPPNPASVALSPSPSFVYVAGTGGSTSSIISAQVRDGADQPVPNPAGFDNVRYEIVGDAGGGILSGNSGSGASVTASTVAGIATVSFQSGTVLPPGPVQIRATVDRSDNNVSNGIGDPISATTSVAVSDGKLFDVVITSPDIEAIIQNLVFDGVGLGGPDGSYSFTVSALATDRQGNPVVPGTTIQFGVIDAPLSGFPGLGGGSFQIAGGDGNPQEGGNLFTAPTGQFTTAGGGAGPGDTILVFGDLVDGNSDLENVRVVQSVNSATSITATSAFNRNDTTGVSVNYGNVLPYVIGRAAEVNITSSALTNSIGVASTTLNYPVSRLGKQAIVWAQGNGATSAVVKTVADIQPLRLPGVAPSLLTISPTPIAGNTTTQVTACLVDAFNSPILGAYVGFNFIGLGVGTGSIDGSNGSGIIADPTGVNGCTTGSLTTAGISDADEAAVIFTAGGEPVSVDILVNTGLILQVSPSVIGGGSGSVLLQLSDGSGNPVPGAQLTGTCSGGPGIVGFIAPTNGEGRTSAFISAGGTLAPVCPGESPNTGTCTFTTATAGGPTATVTVLGPLFGQVNYSPPPPDLVEGDCEDPPAP